MKKSEILHLCDATQAFNVKLPGACDRIRPVKLFQNQGQ